MLRKLDLLFLVPLFAACGSSGEPPNTSPDAAVAADATPSPDAAELADADTPADAALVDAAPSPDATVNAGTMDAGAELLDPPPPRAYSGGTCPMITGAATSSASLNVGFVSAGDERSFRLLVPTAYDPSRPWPVVFAWHWLNASSDSFVRDGELESAVEEMGFIAVLPDRKSKANGDKQYLFDWPFVETSNAEKELTFFDDLLACVSSQYNVDLRRVYGIGVSAGALWLTYLMSTDRVDHLAAVESLSGGVGEVAGVWRMSFTPRSHRFPAIVLWGGSGDWLGVGPTLSLNFQEASMRLEAGLRANDQFVVECVHDQGHTVPPIVPPAGSSTKFWSLWRFMLDHPFHTRPSPYEASGIPAGFPSWCRIAP